MTPNEELDLARVRIIASEMGLDPDAALSMRAVSEPLFETARAIRLGDEARGLCVVPVENLHQIIKWTTEHGGAGKTLALCRAMLAASPERET